MGFLKKLTPAKKPKVLEAVLPDPTPTTAVHEPIDSKADPDDEPTLFTSFMVFYYVRSRLPTLAPCAQAWHS